MTAIYIRSSKKEPFCALMAAGIKTYETRNRRTLDACLGRWCYVMDRGRVVGRILIDSVNVITSAAEWDQLRPLTQIWQGSSYDFCGRKVLYHIAAYEQLTPFWPKSKKLINRTYCEIEV